jgi:hypothetical protein
LRAAGAQLCNKVELVKETKVISGRRVYFGLFAAALAGISLQSSNLRGEEVTRCPLPEFCYCVNSSIIEQIQIRVSQIRSAIREEKAKGKAIGYMSIPISTLRGSYLPVNTAVAGDVKRRVEDRFGASVTWLLNPASEQVLLPQSATGSDYMLMWTQVLGGDDGWGRDFDFVYFVGPSDFGRFFGLDGHFDMEKLDSYYDLRSKTDLALRAIDKRMFREYYGLRASIAFSYGSHDEWNIVRLINSHRREISKTGIAEQLAVFFDGSAIAPGLYDIGVASGNVGICELR